jgi:hypothetical protein
LQHLDALFCPAFEPLYLQGCRRPVLTSPGHVPSKPLPAQHAATRSNLEPSRRSRRRQALFFILVLYAHHILVISINFHTLDLSVYYCLRRAIVPVYLSTYLSLSNFVAMDM